MRRILSPLLCPLALLSACAQVGSYGAVAVEQRRIANDMQARLTMAATCDIALGAYFRELSENERAYVGLVCGGMTPKEEPAVAGEAAGQAPQLPAQLEARDG